MADVYGNAYTSIAAMSSPDCRFGISHERTVASTKCLRVWPLFPGEDIDEVEVVGSDSLLPGYSLYQSALAHPGQSAGVAEHLSSGPARLDFARKSPLTPHHPVQRRRDPLAFPPWQRE